MTKRKIIFGGRPKRKGKRMFNNIGKKLMTLAKVLFWIVTACSVISGIVCMVAGGAVSSAAGIGAAAGAGSVLAGILVIVFGVLLAWISNLGLYAFGQLVDDTHEIRTNTVDNKE